MRAREAEPDERARLWARFADRTDHYQRYAEATERDIPVVILEPSLEGADA